MLSFFKTKKTVSHEESQKIIEQIHNEFDTACDSILAEAKGVLDKAHQSDIANANERLELLRNLGFKQSKTFVETSEKIRNHEINKDLAALIQDYTINYPTLKFLTIEVLNQICNKYKLIYAPVSAFIEEVPFKNLQEIAKAPNLKYGHFSGDYNEVEITTFYENTPESLKKFVKANRLIVPFDDYMARNNRPDETCIKNIIMDLGYVGNYPRYLYREARVLTTSRQGLFIAAPASNFNLEGLKKENDLSYKMVTESIINDPIVFRYCKGGIQVLTKWGLEGKDEALVNEIMN